MSKIIKTISNAEAVLAATNLLEKSASEVVPVCITEMGMCAIYNDEDTCSELVANFLVISAIINKDAVKNAQKARLTVFNCKTQEVKKVLLDPSELKNDRWIGDKLGFKYQCKDYKMLKAVIDCILIAAKEIISYTILGWHDNNYVRVGDIIGESNGSVATTSALAFDSAKLSESTDERQKAQAAINKLLLCTKRPIIMRVVFSTILLSMLTTVFRRTSISRVPQYVLTIQGMTGTGKTTIVQTALSFYKNYTYFDLSVGYTSAALRKHLEDYRDNIIFVDDLVRNDDSEARENVNKLTRLVGNARSSHRTAHGEVSASCLSILAAEVIPDVPPSSLNRMLIIPVSRDDIDFAAVDAVKHPDNRNLYAQAMGDILRYISEKGPDSVVERMSEYFDYFEHTLSEDNRGFCQRRVEAFAWIYAAACFYNEYRSSCGLDEIDTTELVDYAEESLMADVRQAKLDSQEYRFCKALTECESRLQDKSDNQPLKSTNWGYSSERYYFICDSRIADVLRYCEIPFDSRVSLMKTLSTKGILIPEKKRGQKYRLPVEQTYYLTYRIDKEEAKNYVNGIENDQDGYAMEGTTDDE